MHTYQHALILGLGLSGAGAARLLRSEGCAVTLLDRGERTDKRARQADELEALGARVFCGENDWVDGSYDVCVVSPGFALDAPWVREAQQRGIPLCSELELGWGRVSCPVFAITGSNGKSTAVKWCAASLAQAGQHVEIAGNYGVSVCDVALGHPDLDALVLEVSSFQLETVQDFRANVGLMLNLFPNHLDRHGSMAEYALMKARLFSRTRSEDHCFAPAVLCAEFRLLSGGGGTWHTFGSEEGVTYRCADAKIWYEGHPIADLSGTYFESAAHGPMAAAVVGGLHAHGIDPIHAETAARHFQPLPHRVQQVAVQDGVTYVNDSKATNLAAVAHALRAMPGPVHLIAGGLAKETDFKSLKEILAEHAKTVYLIGKVAEDMFSAWSSVVPCHVCRTLDAAVTKARGHAKQGEVILLSPGCASFDQFRSYEERGEQFTRRVLQPVGEEAR